MRCLYMCNVVRSVGRHAPPRVGKLKCFHTPMRINAAKKKATTELVEYFNAPTPVQLCEDVKP